MREPYKAGHKGRPLMSDLDISSVIENNATHAALISLFE